MKQYQKSESTIPNKLLETLEGTSDVEVTLDFCYVFCTITAELLIVRSFSKEI